MGKNYYLERGKPCSKCGRGEAELHIGKSSGGWYFALHVIPELGLDTLHDWKKFWKGKQITNQCGTKISKKKMLDIICNRKYHGTLAHQRTQEFYCMNNAELGLNGLLRSKIDGHHCTGHSVGTWDYIEGEFS